jgi:hypothetical protein
MVVRNAYKSLVGNPERKTELRRRKHRCEDNIKIDIKGGEDMDWIHQAQDRLPVVGHCKCGNEPSEFYKR